ncbi:MAG: class I SAM-dependent methyltransferase [Anaerolineaceae bacterium]|nr:class I SAM-dependent methyltransferase [Anaerolineaceae bacterium]
MSGAILNPRPTESSIEAYYPSTYAAYRPAIADERWVIMRWKRRYNLQHQIRSVTDRELNGRLLDIGCATGNYLAEMRKLNWDVNGIELQTEAAQYAQKRLNLDVYNGDLLTYPASQNKFDVITMWDVLEHTHQPLQVLAKARNLLKPGGLLIFQYQTQIARKPVLLTPLGLVMMLRAIYISFMEKTFNYSYK